MSNDHKDENIDVQETDTSETDIQTEAPTFEEVLAQHDDDFELDWNDEDDVDPDLVELGGRQQSSILRPILMITVLVMGGLVIKDRKDDLTYFMSSSTPLKVGKVIEFPSKKEADPSFVPNIQHNRYVSIEGIPSRRSTNERFRYTKFVGGNVYLEMARKDQKKTALEKAMGKKPKASTDRTYFSGEGRAVQFSKMPHRYRNLRLYYGRNYNTIFCVDLTPAQRVQRMKNRKVTIKRNWTKLYKMASPEERAKQKLTEVPTEKEVEEYATKEPICIDAYIIQAGVKPSSHWWYVLLCGIVALFMVIDSVFLIRWIKDFLAPDDL